MKKKIAFFTGNLDIGGIERAIISYVNNIDYDKYDVTLFLEKMEGAYLDEINKNVHIVNFDLCSSRNVLLRKIKNLGKLIRFSLKYYHQFDFAANFKSTIKSGAILSKRFSSNNAFWIHGHYYHTKEEQELFLKKYKIKKYKKMVFVSNRLKNEYQELFPDNKQELYVINNPIDFNDVLKKSKEKVAIKKKRLTLINVGRHSEEEKNLSMLFRVVKRLVNDGYKFDLWLIGSGPDTDSYKKLVNDLKINNYVKFLGFSKNVYPYYKMGDVVLLTSYAEGNPVVFLETKILNTPIISTDVSDAKIDLNGYGIVTDNNEDSYYRALKSFLDNGYEIKEKFDATENNEITMKKLYQMIGR